MPDAPITLIKGDKIGIETDYRDNLPVNMYAVEKDILGASGYMTDFPGLTSFASVNGFDRGGVYNDNQAEHYRVSGDKMVSVSRTGAVTNLGTIIGSEQAAMPYSFNTQAVIATGNMFLYDSTNGFRQVLDSDLGSPIDCVWVDGYYFLTDGEYIYHTDLTDESAIDPLKYATAEFMPDKSLGVAKTQDNKVIVFGRYSIEYFVNVATGNFAFERVETRAQKIGIVATHAKCEAGTSFYFVGGRKNEAISVFAMGVGQSEKVSTREIDKVLAQYSEPQLSDIRMETLEFFGTRFVLIHLPNEVLCLNDTILRSLGINHAWTILKSDAKGDIKYRGINSVFDSRSGRGS